METDNKYDQTFRNAEIGEKDADWDLEAKQMREDEDERRGKDMEEHFTREPESFGGGGGY